MNPKKLILLICSSSLFLSSCFDLSDGSEKKPDTVRIVTIDSSQARYLDSVRRDSLLLIIDTIRTDSILVSGAEVHTKNVKPAEVVDFAKTLIGVPYKYASADPKSGFDCSGFITYVFGHFKIIVPRSSIDFTNVGRPIPEDSARVGDLVLFTGTDSTEKFVGHMGLVVSNNNGVIEFIHSTSGKKYGVTITPLNNYYQSRYVKTIRIFPE